MKALASLGGRIDDLLNPIVVKELRQAVRSRFVSGLLILLLIVQLAVVALYVMFRPAESASFSEGREINAVLYGILVFSCILFVPLYAGVRLAWERSETQMDLMYTTTISPGAIVRGKLFGAAAITILIYSACVPFMAFTYLLRGVDLPMVFFMLAIGFIEVLAAAQLAIFVACIPTSRLLKVFLGLAAFMGLWIWAGMGAAGLPQVFLRSGIIYSGWQFWASALTALALAAMAMGFLYILSVAVISPPSADRMRPVRFYLMGLWLASGVLAALWAWDSSQWSPWEAWAYTWVFGLAFFLPIMLSERESWGQRIRAGIPRSILARAVSILFTTGSAGGLLWVILMLLLTWAALASVKSVFHNYSLVAGAPDPDILPVMLGISLYAVAYGLTAMLLRKLLGLVKLNIPAGYTWLIAFLMMSIGSVAPYVLCFFLYYDQGSSEMFQDRVWIVTSPMMVLQKEFRDVRLVVAAFWACAAFVATAPWIIRQITAFRPMAPAAAPPAAIPTPAAPAQDSSRGGSPDPPRDAAPPPAGAP
jgi:hypothetical protein